METLLEFIWSKVSEKYRTTASAFRYFDTKGRGKVKKMDLVQGCERLRIKLSTQDIDKVFQHLDTKCQGFLTF